MYCRFCGAELDDDLNFCTRCGEKTVKLRPHAGISELPEPFAQALAGKDFSVTKPTESSAPASVGVSEAAARAGAVVRILAEHGKTAAVKTGHFAKKAGRAAAKAAGKTGAAAAVLGKKAGAAFRMRLTRFREKIRALREGEWSPFDFAADFDMRMWSVCGVLLGLILLALVQYLSVKGSARLLLPFLRGLQPVWLLAILLDLIILLVTLIRGFVYRHSEEYLEAIHPRDSLVPTETVVIKSDGTVFEETEQDRALQENASPAGEEKEALSPEAADIFAELEKLSLDL